MFRLFSFEIKAYYAGVVLFVWLFFIIYALILIW